MIFHHIYITYTKKLHPSGPGPTLRSNFRTHRGPQVKQFAQPCTSAKDRCSTRSLLYMCRVLSKCSWARLLTPPTSAPRATCMAAHCFVCPAVFTSWSTQRTNFPPLAWVCLCMCVGLINVSCIYSDKSKGSWIILFFNGTLSSRKSSQL